MRVDYLNGERVYVVGDHEKDTYVQNQREDGRVPENKIQYCRHADIIKVLNTAFAKTEPILDQSLELIIQFIGMLLPHGTLWLETEKGSIIFDDPRKIKLSKTKKLISKRKLTNIGRPTLIKGGLYKPPVVVHDELLSDEFAAWLQEYRTKNEYDNTSPNIGRNC